jgi:hypothetical protein
MEGHPEQAALAAARRGVDQRHDVEERRRQHAAAGEDLDAPGLFEDEQPVVIAGGRGDEDRPRQAGGDALRRQGELGRESGSQQAGRRQERHGTHELWKVR